MMTEAKTLLKALEGCIQDAMDGAPLVRARYLSRFRLVLATLQGIGNDLLGYKLYDPMAADERVSEVVSKLAIGIRMQSAARTYLRQCEVVAEDILSLIHKRKEAAVKIEKHHLTLLALLVVLDGACSRMYKSWSSYINYAAGELGCVTAGAIAVPKLTRSEALDLITFRLTEGKNRVELPNGTSDTAATVVRGFLPGPVRRPQADPAAATPHPLADWTATTTATASTPVKIYSCPPNATASTAASDERAASLQTLLTRFGPQRGCASPTGAWLSD